MNLHTTTTTKRPREARSLSRDDLGEKREDFEGNKRPRGRRGGWRVQQGRRRFEEEQWAALRAAQEEEDALRAAQLQEEEDGQAAPDEEAASDPSSRETRDYMRDEHGFLYSRERDPATGLDMPVVRRTWQW